LQGAAVRTARAGVGEAWIAEGSPRTGRQTAARGTALARGVQAGAGAEEAAEAGAHVDGAVASIATSAATATWKGNYHQLLNCSLSQSWRVC
jgi:hypothetical protein